MTISHFSALSSDDQSRYEELSASDETVLQIAYIDQDGLLQHASIRCSAPSSDIEKIAVGMSLGLNGTLETLGYELVSMLLIKENGQMFVGERAPPKLVLVRNDALIDIRL